MGAALLFSYKALELQALISMSEPRRGMISGADMVLDGGIDAA